MIPVVNTNLKLCDCRQRYQPRPGSAPHHADCAATPVPIPCPVPRSVTFSVALGACTCTSAWAARGPDGQPRHTESCPARTIRVSCSISGKTWAESEVCLFDLGDGTSAIEHIMEPSPAIQAACRDRWALAKALVLGQPFIPNHWGGPASVMDLFAQRDTVFAALADMARAEQAAFNAQQRVDNAFPFERYNRNYADHRAERPSVGSLAAYVDYLIEQVSVLP